MQYTVIIPAAGQGKRMGAGVNKLLLPLCNRPIIIHTIEKFALHDKCERIILVVRPEEQSELEGILAKFHLTTKVHFVAGGSERQDSVKNGIDFLGNKNEIVLVHDGARPFISHELIENLCETIKDKGPSILGVPLKDTIKKYNQETFEIEMTVDRSTLMAAQTPQGAKAEDLIAAIKEAEKHNFVGTDEASIFEFASQRVTIVLGDEINFKITTPADLTFATFLLERREGK